MTFRYRLQYFLVKKLKLSNVQAKEVLASGKIQINNIQIFENVEIYETDYITYQNQTLQSPKTYRYFKLYKPAGIECTLNAHIPDNLLPFWPSNDLFVIGRLDKASEGLLLLTNNGKIFDKTLRPENSIEKEYLVEVNRPITAEFVCKMASGVNIMGKVTQPCHIWQINENTFGIILTEGRNRQIRRMCYKLGFEVSFLKRTRIDGIELGNMTAGEIVEIEV